MWAATPGRGDSATGEHNCGTAIDINANENYQIRDGQVLAWQLLGAGEQCLFHLPRLLRGAHLCRARLELGRRRLGLQQRRFRGLPRLYALLLHGRVTKQPTPGLGSGVGFHYPPLDWNKCLIYSEAKQKGEGAAVWSCWTS